MNRYFLYLTSLFGTFLAIGSITNISKYNDKDESLYGWLVFGALAQLIHLLMIYQRACKNVVLGSRDKLIFCTIMQLIVCIYYFISRKKFREPLFSDIGIGLIISVMIARFVVLSKNGFKYTPELLFQ